MSPRPGDQTATPQPDGLEARLVATIAPVFRHLLSHARQRPAWKTLTYQQYNVLRIIDGEEPMPQADIARRLLVSAPVVTRLAATLVETGYVLRGTDPDDRRAVRLSITPKGRRRVRAMRRELLEAAAELLAPLPEDRRMAVGTALDELQVLLPARKVTSRPR